MLIVTIVLRHNLGTNSFLFIGRIFSTFGPGSLKKSSRWPRPKNVGTPGVGHNHCAVFAWQCRKRAFKLVQWVFKLVQWQWVSAILRYCSKSPMDFVGDERALQPVSNVRFNWKSWLSAFLIYADDVSDCLQFWKGFCLTEKCRFSLELCRVTRRWGMGMHPILIPKAVSLACLLLFQIPTIPC